MRKTQGMQFFVSIQNVAILSESSGVTSSCVCSFGSSSCLSQIHPENSPHCLAVFFSCSQIKFNDICKILNARLTLVVCLASRKKRRNAGRRSGARRTRSASIWKGRGKTERSRRQHWGRKGIRRGPLKSSNKSRSQLKRNVHCLWPVCNCSRWKAQITFPLSSKCLLGSTRRSRKLRVESKRNNAGWVPHCQHYAVSKSV